MPFPAPVKAGCAAFGKRAEMVSMMRVACHRVTSSFRRRDAIGYAFEVSWRT